MRKFYLLVLSLFAMLAFGAFAVSQAFAETVWLVGGSRASEEVLVLSETLGVGLLLVDLAFLVDVDCSGLNEGFVGGHLVGGVLELGAKFDEITKITDLEGKEPPILCEYLERGPCETSTLTADVSPVGLPWLTELELVGASNLDKIFGAGAEEVAGWTVAKCLVLGISITDTCTAKGKSADIDNNAEAGDVVALFSEAITGLANCTQGGAESGVVEGEVLIFTESGASLAVSEG